LCSEVFETIQDDNLNNPEVQESLKFSVVAEEQRVLNQAKKKHRKEKVKKGFYYSFLTIVLLFCIVQVGYCLHTELNHSSS